MPQHEGSDCITLWATHMFNLAEDRIFASVFHSQIYPCAPSPRTNYLPCKHALTLAVLISWKAAATMVTHVRWRMLVYTLTYKRGRILIIVSSAAVTTSTVETVQLTLCMVMLTILYTLDMSVSISLLTPELTRVITLTTLNHVVIYRCAVWHKRTMVLIDSTIVFFTGWMRAGVRLGETGLIEWEAGHVPV